MFAFVFDYFPVSPSISSTNIYLRTCHLPKAVLVLWPQEKRQDHQSGENRDNEGVMCMLGAVTTLGPVRSDTDLELDGGRTWGVGLSLSLKSAQVDQPKGSLFLLE